MKNAKMALLLCFLGGFSAQAHVHPLENFSTKPILADLNDLRALGIPVTAQEDTVEVGYAVVNPEMLQRLQERAHQVGKCGGFEDLSLETLPQTQDYSALFRSLVEAKKKNDLYDRAPFRLFSVEKNADIEAALLEVDEANLLSYVQWLSSFPNRNAREADPNKHVVEMKARLEAMLSSATVPYEIHEITHSSTKQRTLHVRLPGASRPNEIVVLGGHLDSISQGWGNSGKIAPGADDNASGSANLIEALRILSTKPQLQRTVDFFWYAAEEQGLLGSAEIAKSYKESKKDVIAVLQLDMTLKPGSGEMVIGSMTDFTSAWLRDYLKSINESYLNVRIVEDKCGYGCSDHASWHRQGYPALMPHESAFRNSNKDIHTARDVVSPSSNFRHSAVYTKIAVIMAMDLGNNTARQPF